MKRIKIALVVTALSSLYLNQASARQISLGLKGGTLGAGLESTYRINSLFSLAGSVNGLSIARSDSTKSLAIDGKIRLLTAGVSLGIHPFQSCFKFLAGIFYNGNQLNLTDVRLKQDITLSGILFTRDQVGQAQLKVHYSKVSPYLGFGFDSAFCNKSPWSLTGEIGVLFQFSPKAKLTRTGVGDFPALKSYLEREVEKAAGRDILKYYPVMAIGIKYSF